MRNSLLLLCATVFAATAVAQAPKSPQKPGKWQMKMEVDVPGVPMKMPAITTETCVTAADLADPQKSVPSDAKSDCTVADYKVVGNTVSWTADCPKQKTKGSGEITFAGETLTGTMKMKTPDGETSMKYSGKWLGTCTK